VEIESEDGRNPVFQRALVEARTAAGLTQEELAQRAQISARAMHNLERGRVARPRRDTVERLVAALGLTGWAAERFTAASRGRSSGEELPGPAQLPAELPDFTGRTSELDRLVAVLTPAAGAVVTAVEGGGGIGKTALAVRAAHRLRDRYPDGQLYVNLAGSRSEPVSVADALGGFLVALGVAGDQLPEDETQRAALYRSAVADRRVLVVLDDGRDAAQVRPLLPGGARCAALVTSRRRLTDLEGCTHLRLGELAEGEAVDLLGRIAGVERVAAEPSAAARLVAACGRLPLAVRIAAARLAARPTWTVASLESRLADERRRMDELAVGDLAVRASFRLSHDRLTGPQAAMFGLLGLWPGRDLPAAVAAALAGRPTTGAEQVLEALVDVHLLETTGPGRYRLHDLLHVFARELLADRFDEEERTAARRRVLAFVAGSAFRAERTLRPNSQALFAEAEIADERALTFDSYAAALSWYEQEWPSLSALLKEAAADPDLPARDIARLATLLALYPFVRGDWAVCERLCVVALDHSSRAGDASLVANAHHRLGIALAQLGRAREAAQHQEQALSGFRATGQREREAAILNSIGKRLASQERRYPEAIRYMRDSLRVAREIQDRPTELLALSNLGAVEHLTGRYADARPHMEQALALCRESGDRRLEAVMLSNLGCVLLELGSTGRAVAYHRQALEIIRDVGDRRYEASVLTDLSIACRRSGQAELARIAAGEAVAIRHDIGDRSGAGETLLELGRAQVALGDPVAARQSWREALEILTEVGSPAAADVRQLLAGGDRSGGDLGGPAPQP
jgi:tetratricopeptide (TPR) repeat protein/transcriptional regulator with XRE-family HTH domain